MPPPEIKTPPPMWQIAVGFAILYIVWGTTYLAIKIGVADDHLPPFLFAGTRIGAAGLVLLFVQSIRRQPLGMGRSEWPALLCGGILLFIGGNGLLTYALRHIHSGESAVLAATMTLWIAIFSSCIPGGDRLHPIGWLGLAVGIGGVGVLEWPQIREQGFSFSSSIGPWLALGSAAAWGIGSVLLRQMPSKMPRLTASGWQMVVGGGGLFTVGMLLGEEPPEHISTGAVAVFVYLLVFGSLIAFVTFQWMLEHVSATKVGTYGYVNPLVAILLGSWWRDEPLTTELFAGMGLILVAVFLVRGGGSTSPEIPPEQAIRELGDVASE